MQVEVYKKDGSVSGERVELPASIFEVEPNDHAIYQAVRVYLANQRQGTHKTKTYGEVSGSGKKLWKQKHTGRARIGAVRSPLWKGGGAIFGPVPRDYSMSIPQKMKQLARKSALSYRAKEGNLKVVEDFTFDSPKTKDMISVLKSLGIKEKKVLLLLPSSVPMIVKSGRNIPSLHIIEAGKASTYELMDNQMILMQKSAIESLVKSLAK
ncbi:MAG: 50S ribosomal protein L4 [Ignavibacteriales bacterium]|nr:50S ribosomal protein L4 [Ignavibacteriales bacterium]